MGWTHLRGDLAISNFWVVGEIRVGFFGSSGSGSYCHFWCAQLRLLASSPAARFAASFQMEAIPSLPTVVKGGWWGIFPQPEPARRRYLLPIKATKLRSYLLQPQIRATLLPAGKKLSRKATLLSRSKNGKKHTKTHGALKKRKKDWPTRPRPDLGIFTTCHY